jgi:magnesium transporter
MLAAGGFAAATGFLAVRDDSLADAIRIAGVLALSLVAVCTLAATVGALMPMLARRIGIDPAVASAPFVTTVVDTTGLLLYFLIARVLLSDMIGG